MGDTKRDYKLNTAKNSVNSSIDTWVSEIEAMQDDCEDK